MSVRSTTERSSVTVDHPVETLGDDVDIVVVFDDHANSVGGTGRVEMAAEHPPRLRPADGLGGARALDEVELAQPPRRRTDIQREGGLDLRCACPHDLDLAIELGIFDPVIEAPSPQSIMQLASAVGGQHDERRSGRTHRTDLGNGDLEVREQLEQESLELLICAVDLVDEEYSAVARAQRRQERPLDEEALGEDVARVAGLLQRA